MLSITTDYKQDTGDPSPYLRRIAEAGFSHIHWCHHWNNDFIYAPSEIEQIGRWLKDYGLQLNDLHGSEGREKGWLSPLEYRRQAGVELVKNRIEMTARLGGDVVIMHVPAEPRQTEPNQRFWDQLQRTFDELEPFARSHGVRLAIENLIVDNFATIERIFARYSPDFVGLCYDSGHANIGEDRMDRLGPLRDRLLALHLHDNHGTADQHKLPFSGTIDWSKLAGLIAGSAYRKCLSLEVVIHNMGLDEEAVFLAQALASGNRLAQLIAPRCP
jgi:sugar phosphate isomerase/epimerase